MLVAKCDFSTTFAEHPIFYYCCCCRLYCYWCCSVFWLYLAIVIVGVVAIVCFFTLWNFWVAVVAFSVCTWVSLCVCVCKFCVVIFSFIFFPAQHRRVCTYITPLLCESSIRAQSLIQFSWKCKGMHETGMMLCMGKLDGQPAMCSMCVCNLVCMYLCYTNCVYT